MRSVQIPILLSDTDFYHISVGGLANFSRCFMAASTCLEGMISLTNVVYVVKKAVFSSRTLGQCLGMIKVE